MVVDILIVEKMFCNREIFELMAKHNHLKDAVYSVKLCKCLED
jgi:hypothetical protein